MFNLSDTICAICTPRGAGGIAAIRISGVDSWKIIHEIFTSSLDFGNRQKTQDERLNSKNTKTELSHMKAQHGYIISGNKVIDEVVILPYKSPNSFTAEDVVEIFCHGGMQVSSMILDLCLKSGARLAQNGEFTFRAFVNGRIDLTEAEAINELINADSEKAVLSSTEALSGSLKKKVLDFKEELLQLLGVMESAIEFPSDVAPTNNELVVKKLNEVNEEILKLIESSKEGQLLRTGIKVSIVGEPNVGKSSLLNQFLESNRAIVTDTPGTTRDTLEEKVILDGYPIVFTDTAGIRDAGVTDESESIGIERSKEELEKSDIALVVIDLSKQNSEQNNFLKSLNGKPKITIGNKVDLVSNDERLNASDQIDISISAKEGTNLSELKSLILNKIKDLTGLNDFSSDQMHVNERQKELLIQSSNSIECGLKMINDGVPEDIVADELKKSIAKLDQICGSDVNEEVISGIFEKFCIGK